MDYWSNVFAMAGAAMIAVAFVSSSLYPFCWGIIVAYAGYKLRRR